MIVATYILAPLPNALCGRCAGEDDLMSDYNGFVKKKTSLYQELIDNLVVRLMQDIL